MTHITENKQQGIPFLKMPTALFFNTAYEGLSPYAKLAYMFLLDRKQLSIKNGLTDKKGIPYIYFSRAELQCLLSISDKTCTKVMSELKQYGLITEKRQGLGKANILFILEPENLRVLNRKKYDSRTGNFTTLEPENLRLSTGNFTTLEPENLRSINTYNIKTDNSKTNFNEIESKNFEEVEDVGGGGDTAASQKPEKFNSPSSRFTDNDPVLIAYKENIHKDVKPAEKTRLYELVLTYGNTWLLQAIKEAALHNASNVKYLESMLEKWKHTGSIQPWNVSKEEQRFAELDRSSLFQHIAEYIGTYSLNQKEKDIVEGWIQAYKGKYFELSLDILDIKNYVETKYPQDQGKHTFEFLQQQIENILYGSDEYE